MLDVLNTWYGYLIDNQEAGADVSPEQNLWRSAIYPQLLVTINGASQLCRGLLKDALIRYWLDSEHSEVRRSALALLTRSYILDGVVLDVPISRFGVLMIDAGRVDEEDYLEAAFTIAQRLTALAPLRVYHLGSQTPPISLGEFHPEDQDTGTANSKALILTGHPRSRLMMPLLEPIDPNLPGIDPTNCHFVLILNTREVLDWGEILSEAQEKLASVTQAAAAIDPIQRHKNKNKDAEPAPETQTWRWMGKFILSDKELPAPPEGLPDRPYFTYDAEEHFKPEILDAIEGKLQQQIILALHRLPLEGWIADLARYAQFPDGFPETPETMMSKCRAWLTEINVVFETIPPRDVTLNISWLMLLMAQRELQETGGLSQVVTLVASWLSSEDPNEQLMGRACTKQLFNFYGVEGMQPIVAKHGKLLRLLRPFMHQKPDYVEFSVIFRLLLRWAEQIEWSERLISPADGTISEMLTAVAEIEQKRDKDWMIGELNYQEARLALVALFLQLQRTSREFLKLIMEVIEWHNAEVERQKQYAAAQELTQQNQLGGNGRGRGRGRGAALPAWMTQAKPRPQGISDRTADDLLKLPGLNEASQGRIFSELRRIEFRLPREPDYRNNFHTWSASLKNAVDAIRLQIFSSELALPKLPDGYRYGLFFIDASSHRQGDIKEIAMTTLAWLSALHAAKEAKIVPVLHRLGRQDVVYTWSEKRPGKVQLTQEDILPSSLPHFAPLLGPILDHYPQDDVAFVVIISTNAVRDLNDWTEQPIWQTRINLLALSENAEHAAAQRIELKVDTNATIENLLKKVNQMNAPTRNATP